MDAAFRKMQPDDVCRVWLMYLEFEPKACFQGLPPVSPGQTRAWLQALGEDRAEQFVIDVNDRVIGHSMLCAGPHANERELAIFLHQDYRGRGLGKRLLLCSLNYACQKLQLDRVWLSVRGDNPAAIRCFESAGFRPIEQTNASAWELRMDRALHCEHCRGDDCPLFQEKLPRSVSIDHRHTHR